MLHYEVKCKCYDKSIFDVDYSLSSYIVTLLTKIGPT